MCQNQNLQIFLLYFLLSSYNSEMPKSYPKWLKEYTLKDIFSNNLTYQCHLTLHSNECKLISKGLAV